jgi:hypothetical protein
MCELPQSNINLLEYCQPSVTTGNEVFLPMDKSGRALQSLDPGSIPLNFFRYENMYPSNRLNFLAASNARLYC